MLNIVEYLASSSRLTTHHAAYILKKAGQLTPPAEAAQRLLRYLERPDFGDKPVDDMRKA